VNELNILSSFKATSLQCSKKSIIFMRKLQKVEALKKGFDMI